MDTSGFRRLGRVYLWTRDPSNFLGGTVRKAVAPLDRLNTDDEEHVRLAGRYVRVRNGGSVNELDETTGAVRVVPIGDAQPDNDGNFLFEPGRGGGRIDKVELAAPDFRWRYIQAAHFGEVNTYYHVDRIAAYVDDLLRELGAPSLPPVVAVVNAHHAATEANGLRDGVRGTYRWMPFQGGHYRLPGRRFDIDERQPLSPDGEIHLGPGWRLVEHGALVEAAGSRYRANASHNAGIIYHEYGHHIARHTADFRANALRRPLRQNNRKTAIDEGTCDYWAATMLGTPHIWAWHRQHDEYEVHPRSLTSASTMADYDAGPRADAHTNGTIWGAALWDVRSALCAQSNDGARTADLLVLRALLLLGGLLDPRDEPGIKNIRRARERFAAGLAALIRADETLFAGAYANIILPCFAQRGIVPDTEIDWERFTGLSGAQFPIQGHQIRLMPPDIANAAPYADLLRHVVRKDIPDTDDVLTKDALSEHIHTQGDPTFSLIAVGDIMLGGRTTAAIKEHGADYPLDAVLPLLQRSQLVLGNLEGPFARKAQKMARNFSYRVNPALAMALARAGVNVMTLANNHLLDCGRAGVVETLEALARANIAALGAGINTEAAHVPVIREVGGLRIGLLGYYWNSRCAARENLPGSAMDTPEALASDIGRLRGQVDRVVVTFHWGIPYEREPLPEDRAKARFAIDCGADVVIGHHPHVIQPIEVHRGRPIIYSVGNFAFGSGNSKAEGLLVALQLDPRRTKVAIYPLYVKNRDPRVCYQPKVLAGIAAERALCRLVEASGQGGRVLRIEHGRGLLDLPWPEDSSGGNGPTDQ